ncbi:LOW QUALITY PROTEIN: hypothetical protein IFM46972_11438 [Aspergillus udagawae]|uniref:Uncharacterized protein n=1 Tax=Aspergillus udagawae TaxID=91492 RepID=A0A8H3SGV5_9EURO|nr:LOW QUALITY PROTEIN: hypothetical protein IFM46972_11438 [Aspergillus udagawae]
MMVSRVGTGHAGTINPLVMLPADNLPWNEIMKHFLGRTKGSLQYSTKLRGLSWFDESSEAAKGLDSSLHESACSSGNSGYQQRYGRPRERRRVECYSPA